MARLRLTALAAFAALVLAAPALAQQRSQEFTRPVVHDFRLDFCSHAGRDCGQPAADLFCQQMGFERAAAWTPSGPVGGRTLIFGNGMLCEGPQCASFATIQCVAGQPQAPAQMAAPVAPQTTAPQPPVIQAPIASTPIQPAPQTTVAAPIPQPRPNALNLAPELPVEAPVPRPRPLRLASPDTLANAPPPLVPNTLAAAPARPILTLNPAFASIPSPPATTRPDATLSRSAGAITARWALTLRELHTYPGGASIFKCLRSDCEFAVTPDIEIDPAGEDRTQLLFFSVKKVPHAGGALWQVSTEPFPEFAEATPGDYDPPGLVFSGRQDKTRNSYDFDFAELAAKVPAPPSGARGVGTIFYIRVLPVAFNGLGEIVGQPSNVMRVYYGFDAPEPPPLVLPEPEVVEQAPPVQLVSVEFKPYRWIKWPAGCLSWEAYRDAQDKSFFEDVGDVFTDIWDFAAGAYQWAKDRVIDIASALTFGIVPDSVLELALDVALASAGIPPDIPNLDDMISGGVDHLAGEMAKAAVAQIPSGSLAADLGELAGSAVAEELAKQGEEALRARLQQELEARSREALIRAADEMEKATSTPHSDALCQDRFIPPSYRITVANASDRRVEDAWVRIGDSEGVYQGVHLDFDLWPHQTMSMMAVPEPRIVDVWDNRLVRMEPMATDKNISNWWNEILFKTDTSIRVSLKGDYVCFGTCNTQSRTVLSSPPLLLTEPYFGQPLLLTPGLEIVGN